jgi:hypothetical protein
MKHMLMDPAFPDLVAAAAAAEREREIKRPHTHPEPEPEDIADAFLTFLGKIHFNSSRLW